MILKDNYDKYVERAIELKSQGFHSDKTIAELANLIYKAAVKQ